MQNYLSLLSQSLSKNIPHPVLFLEQMLQGLGIYGVDAPAITSRKYLLASLLYRPRLVQLLTTDDHRAAYVAYSKNDAGKKSKTDSHGRG